MNRALEPEVSLPDNITFLQPEKIRLANGTPAYLICAGEQEVVKLEIVFNAGVWYGDYALVASAVNSLLQAGTKSKTAFEISQAFDQYGAYLRTEVSLDIAVVRLFTLTKFVPETFPLLLEIIQESVFPKNEIDLFQEHGIQQLKINNQRVEYTARGLFSKALFPGNHRYGRIIEESDYLCLNPSIITDWHNCYYTPDNCFLVLSGLFTQKEVEVLNNVFGRWTAGKEVQRKDTANLDVAYQAVEKHVEKQDAVQTAIRIGCRAPNKLDEDYIPLMVLTTILGGYFGSRLMRNLREEKGYTYGVGCSLVSNIRGGYVVISTQVGKPYLADSLTQINLEINNLKEQLVKDEELSLVKNYLSGVFLRSLDGTMAVSDRLKSVVVYGQTMDFYKEYLQKVKNTNSYELQSLAFKYFSSKMTCITVG